MLRMVSLCSSQCLLIDVIIIVSIDVLDSSASQLIASHRIASTDIDALLVCHLSLSVDLCVQDFKKVKSSRSFDHPKQPDDMSPTD